MSEYKRVPVRGYEDRYEVDTNGVIYSISKGIAMKPQVVRRGYLGICLRKDGKRESKYVHRIVAEAFIPNPNNLPEVNHKDEIKLNNKATNLEWCTRKYNVNYGTATERRLKKLRGRPEPKWKSEAQSERMKKYWATHRHPSQKIDIKCVNDGHVFKSIASAMKEYGISRHALKRMLDTGIAIDGMQFQYLKEAIR